MLMDFMSPMWYYFSGAMLKHKKAAYCIDSRDIIQIYVKNKIIQTRLISVLIKLKFRANDSTTYFDNS